MRIAVFGVGRYYEKRKKELMGGLQGDKLVCFFDNKFEENDKIDDIPAVNPRYLKLFSFDIIVVMSSYFYEIYNQLCALGVKDDNIITWKQYKCIKSGGAIERWIAESPGKGERILIVVNPVYYDGASMAAVYAAMALRSRGYCVWMITNYAEKELREMILREGINLAISSDLPYFGEKVKEWINIFSAIIVNVFPNIYCACELSLFKPVIWWIHESDRYCEIYQNTFKLFPSYRKRIKANNINIVAVSELAMMRFQNYYPNIKVRIMPYGLPDFYIKRKKRKEKLVFAIIGTICYLKGQDVFINAIKKLTNKELNLAEFWIIGKPIGDYALTLSKELNEMNMIKFKGELNRSEIEKLFAEIDVLVSASREDSLPIVVTEGMMNKKVCIIPDVIGSVKYVKDMGNGIIFSSQDVDELAMKIRWCIKNKEKLSKIGAEARKTYINEFSMSRFANKLESEILYAKNMFYNNVE